MSKKTIIDSTVPAIRHSRRKHMLISYRLLEFGRLIDRTANLRRINIVCDLARKRKYVLPPFPSKCTTVSVLLVISESKQKMESKLCYEFQFQHGLAGYL